mgnify:CR=1 FL=1
MAEAEPITITTNGDDTELHLSDITVRDPEVVEYFEKHG